MKKTIDLPKPLIDEVERLAAREQRHVGEVIAELVRAGLHSRSRPPAQSGDQVGDEQWMLDWLALVDDLLRNAPAGPTARTYLDEDRSRLEAD